MPFQVYEQGRGIATPWYDVFPPRHVDKASAIGGSLKVSPRDQFKDGDHPYDSVAGSLQRNVSQSISSEHRRQPVFYAEQIMSKRVQTVPLELSLAQLWQQFTRSQFRHFPVLDSSGKLLGIVSDRDALLVTSGLLLSEADVLNSKSSDLTVGDIMTRKVLTASGDTYLRTLAEVMLDHRIGAMPIMAEEKLIGIVTRSDILKTLTHHTPVDLWT